MKKIVFASFLARIVIVVGLVMIGCASAPITSPVSAEEQIEKADSYFDNNNLKKAHPLYLDIANNENIPTNLRAWAQFRVGRIYDRQGDVEKSIEWYTKAATLGEKTAQLNLGNIYDKQKNYDKAFEWYVKSAEQGVEQAAWNVTVYYYQGFGVQKDDEKFAEWCLIAYKLGSKEAEKLLRQMGFIK